MKRVISLLLSIVMLLSITAGMEFNAYGLANSGSCGNNVTWTFDSSSGTLIIRGTGEMNSYNESTYQSPFYRNSDIKSVIIRNGVTSLGVCAFCYCKNMTSITIPNSITSIGRYTFRYCSSLTGIVIPESISKILTSAFDHCSALTSVSIPESVELIADLAFSSCTGLKSITIPKNVTIIGRDPFGGCSNLTSISVDSENTVYDSRNNCNAIIKSSTNELIQGCKNTIIPEDIKSIYQYAFYGCSCLTSITIPSSVTNIGNSAFSNCKGLTCVTIPNSVTNIGEYAFSGCLDLISVAISENVKSIKPYTFYACKKLKNINIPDCVASIGEYAFYGCIGLTSITIPKSVTSIGKSAISDLKDVYYSGSEREWNAIDIDNDNDCLLDSNIHYYYSSKPGSESCVAHTWDNGTINNKPTCTENGLKSFTCTTCGATMKDILPAAHSYNTGVVTTQPTCTVAGVKTFTCSVCGGTKTEIVPATGVHIYDSGKITSQPTCTSAGIKTFTCSVCGGTKTESVPATGVHTYNNGAITTQPTCAKTGVKTYTCTVCGATKTESVPATGVHTYNDGTVTTQPTCTKTGLKKYTCTTCGNTYNESIDALGHDFVKSSFVAPTYTSRGYNVYKCSRCTEQYYDDYVDALNLPFNTKIQSQNNQTYNIELNKSGVLVFDFAGDGRCSICIYDKDGVRVDELAPEYNSFLNKTYLNSNTGYETNRIVGLFAGKYKVEVKCSGKFEMYIDYQSANETFTKTKDYTYRNASTAAKINLNTQYNGFLCNLDETDAYCFEVPKGSRQTPINILFSVNNNPLFYSYCYVDLYSENSGQIFSEFTIGSGDTKSKTVYLNEGKYYITFSKGHSLGNASPVTYSFKALCASACTNHSYLSTINKAATCEESGVITYTCYNCGNSYTTTINALGHNYVTTIKKATPTNDGYSETSCTRCGDEQHYKYIPRVYARLSSTTYTYNGKARKPKVTVYNENGTLSKDCYTVTYPKGRKKLGTYTVKIELKGKYYSGTIKKSFKIVKKVAKPAQVKGVTAKTTLDSNYYTGAFKSTWKKIKSADGYQVQTGVQYGNKKKWTKTKTISGASTTTYTANEYYGSELQVVYVRVRAYKLVNDKKLYGKWSKTIKTKVVYK